MDWNGLLSSIAVVVALTSAGGFGLQRSKVSALRVDIEDERGRNQALRLDVADLKQKDTEKDAQIKQLASDLRHAEQMATGEQHWKQLDAHLENHHQEAKRHWSDIKTAVEALGERLP